MLLFGDVETTSTVGLKQAGTHRYAETAKLLLFAYAIGDGEVRCWDAVHDPMPTALRDALHDPACTLVFHNAAFDRVILNHVFKHEFAVERFHCTMARAYAHGMPGKLETLGNVLGLEADQKKIADGQRLMRLFCEKHESPLKYPEEWLRFIEYCVNDVVAMREVYKRLPRVNYCDGELALYHQDQRINDRGFAVDLALAKAAKAMSATAREKLDARIFELTEGRVNKLTQRDRMLDEIDVLEALTKDDVKTALAGELDPVTRELLEIRQLGNRASTAKYDRLLRSVSSDGRLRGVLVFAGAARTARWSSHVFQAHNLPRPKLEADVILTGIDAIKSGTADLLFDDVIGLCADALRGVIVAAKGKKLCVSDWSNIEGRGLAWLAGETWKLEAFRALDRGEGPDLYVLGYSRATGTPLAEVDGKKRQMGKGMELASGYGGGVGAFITIGTSYGLDLAELAREVPKLLPHNRIQDARGLWHWAVKHKRTHGLPEAQYVACEALKQLWRDNNPATVHFWAQLEDAAKLAIVDSGKRYEVGRCWFQAAGSTLMLGLPSGRRLIYPVARVSDRGEISFMKTPGWTRSKLYGGMIAENVTQAAARDVLAAALPAVEAAGFDILLHVHDEIITEVNANSPLDHEALSAIMVRDLPWADGLPLAAEGYSATRYRKGA